MLLIVLALHALVLFLPFLRPSQPKIQPRFEIESISQEALQKIRLQKSLLIQEESKPQTSKTAPKNARYLSDRNQHVLHETRSKTYGIPTSSSLTQNTDQKNSKKPLIPLSELGVQLFRSTQTPSTTPSGISQTTPQEAWISDPRLPISNRNLLNTEQSTFYSFFARIYRTIGPLWQSYTRTTFQKNHFPIVEYLTEADILIDAQGYVYEVRILKSAGIPDLDHNVELAWYNSGPFPNPPRELFQADGYLHTHWTFQVSSHEGFFLQRQF